MLRPTGGSYVYIHTYGLCDVQGGDFNIGTLNLLSSWKECKAQCDHYYGAETGQSCVAWSYLYVGNPTSTYPVGTCWLKDQYAQIEAVGHPGIVSGWTARQQYSLRGGTSMNITAANPRQCAANCAQLGGNCSAWTYTEGVLPANGTCWLSAEQPAGQGQGACTEGTILHS